MGVLRFAFLFGFLATLATGCGPALPGAGNYATVSGRVVDGASGAAVANAVVTVNAVLSATTDAAGNFRVATVPTGPWQYDVRADPNYFPLMVSNPPTLGPGEQRSITITLTHR